MTIAWTGALASALHLLALGFGFAGIAGRTRALLRDDRVGALAPDTLWGIAAVLWLGTGLWRAFGGLEKGSAFYLQSGMFQLKLGLFALVWVLELWPMVTLIRWRIAGRRGQPLVGPARTLGWISAAELGLDAVIPFVAAAMARGL
jgi:putative membrane protein